MTMKTAGFFFIFFISSLFNLTSSKEVFGYTVKSWPEDAFVTLGNPVAAHSEFTCASHCLMKEISVGCTAFRCSIIQIEIYAIPNSNFKLNSRFNAAASTCQLGSGNFYNVSSMKDIGNFKTFYKDDNCSYRFLNLPALNPPGT